MSEYSCIRIAKKECFPQNLSISNLKIGNHAEYGLIGLPNYYLKNFDHGEIKTKEVGKLLRAETMLNKFFTSTYRDIEGIYYDKESAENDTIKYTLYVRKNICGTIRNINFDLESTGTQALLRLLPFLLASIEGSTVIIDEFDSGIHDLLSRSLIKSIFKDISGQLIMTTHNTSLKSKEMLSGIPWYFPWTIAFSFLAISLPLLSNFIYTISIS